MEIGRVKRGMLRDDLVRIISHRPFVKLFFFSFGSSHLRSAMSSVYTREKVEYEKNHLGIGLGKLSGGFFFFLWSEPENVGKRSMQLRAQRAFPAHTVDSVYVISLATRESLSLSEVSR